ncbi:hypothetical protein [Streptomyces atroolivaceus]|uniref:hypothetical protein n=1 Tax=Streptomyces atroolivaceus TaxID=66869 RepID=UPI00368ABAF1
MQGPINSLGEIAVDVLVCGPTASRHCPPGNLLRTADRPPFLVVLDREDDMRFTRAHRIGWGWWAELINLHRTTQTDVVMVHHAAPSRDLTHLLRHCDHRVITTHAALRSLHPPAGAAPGN